MRCKRWIAHAVLSRVEETINQYTRTKIELEHLKKHKVGRGKHVFLKGHALISIHVCVRRQISSGFRKPSNFTLRSAVASFFLFEFRIERVYHQQKRDALDRCKTWSAIWNHLEMSGQLKETGLLRGGFKDFFMFQHQGASPDPQAVVSKARKSSVCHAAAAHVQSGVGNLPGRRKQENPALRGRTRQGFRSRRAHAGAAFRLTLLSQCKSVKERFFNLERRFACYRKYLLELHSPELDEAGEESQLREDAKWFREQTGKPHFRFICDCVTVLLQRTSSSARIRVRQRRAPTTDAPTLISSGNSSSAL